VLALTGGLAAGCDPTEYTDVNFGSNVGADYMVPSASDAGMDADAATPESTAGTITARPRRRLQPSR